MTFTDPPKRIIIVEDEPSIAEILQYNLEREGFEVEWCQRGERALERIRRQTPALVILDLMLPGLDGLEITRLLRREPATSGIPLIMLTAKSEEIDRVVGFELGADDYITKPFSPREVVLRVKAVLRRGTAPGAGPAKVREAGEIRLDIGEHRAFVAEDEVTLTVTEFRLLQQLVESRGRVQSRDQLLHSVWGYREGTDTRTVDTHIRRLRHKLRSHSETASAQIETVVGVGYRLRG